MDFLTHRQQIGELDLGNMLYNDKAPLTCVTNCSEQDILDAAKECTVHFFKELWKLPTKNADNVTVTDLPETTFLLPREKPCPAGRNLTKWEQFARLKGIQKKKRSRMLWDEESGSYKPRYGRGRIDDIKSKWCIEVPGNADPNEDQFEKMNRARRERAAKNELARLKNIKRSVKSGPANIGVLSESLGSKNEVSRALSIAKTSNASLGTYSGAINEARVQKSTEKKMMRKTQNSKSSKRHGGKSIKNKAKPFKKGSRTGKKKS